MSLNNEGSSDGKSGGLVEGWIESAVVKTGL
jgi:hypothetical protein